MLLKKQPIVFLSYAREDTAVVTDLRERLEAEGFSVWMDKFSILGGEDWDRSIHRGVSSCDLFVACLSPHSVRKRGYVQREMKLAESVLQGKLPGDIFVVPLMLAPSEIPESVERFQVVRLFEEDGYERLRQCIHEGIRRANEPRLFVSDDSMITVVDHELHEPLAEGHRYHVSVRYPQLSGLEESRQDEINTVLRARAFAFLQDARSRYHGADAAHEDAFQSTPSSYKVGYTVTLLSAAVLSVMFNVETYGAGAMHGNEHTVALNYQLRPILPLQLRDLFHHDNETNEFLGAISAYCIRELHHQAWSYCEAVQGPAIRAYDDEQIHEGAGPDEENFKAYNLMNDGLMLSFDPYSVGSYSWGTRRVLIPYEDLPSLCPDGPAASIWRCRITNNT